VALSVQEQLVELFSTKGRRVIVVAGPTGVGKTRVSLELAQMLSGEIISADSMQVYRGMDIGTAKVDRKDRDRIPHHLIDIRDIADSFNVYDYFEEAKAAMDDIFSRGKVPIIVGGTGFYIHTILYGPPSGPPSNQAIRDIIEAEADRVGTELLFQKLQEFDPLYASTITSNDRHKIVRAFEIIEISGKRVSDFSWKTRHLLPGYDFRCWFLHTPRPLLYERLSERCDQMLASGLLDEVLELDRRGIRHNRTASQAIGYRQTLDFLETGRTEKDCKDYLEKFKQASHHLAKRQFTWFRKEPSFRWIDISTTDRQSLLDFIASDYSSLTPFAPPPIAQE
jgi:tRNA dimethylallyltransferase